MNTSASSSRQTPFVIAMALLILLGLIALNALQTTLFPVYFLYILVGWIFFVLFSNIDFDIVSLFSRQGSSLSPL